MRAPVAFGLFLALTAASGPTMAQEAWRISAEPILRVGVTEPGRSASAARLSDGRVAVVGASGEIHFYDAAGARLRTVPSTAGASASIGWIHALPGDSLLVYGMGMPRRATLLGPEGGLAGSLDLPADGRPPRLLGRFPDGTLLLGLGNPPDTRADDGPMRGTVALVRASAAGVALHSIVELPGEELYQRDGQPVLPLFHRSPRVAVAGNRVFAGENGAGEIGVYRADGTREGTIRLDAPPRPVTLADAMEEARTRIVEARGWDSPERDAGETAVAVSRRIVQRNLAERREGELAERYGGMPVPATMPVFGAMLADAAGNLWVQEYPAPGEPGSAWTVYDPAGYAAATVLMPDGLQPLQVGADFVLGVRRDRTGASIVVHALGRSP